MAAEITILRPGLRPTPVADGSKLPPAEAGTPNAVPGAVRTPRPTRLKDYAEVESPLFGDRPPDNPGYSKFALSGEVKAGSPTLTKAQTLDVWRVAQRLKYLGFPAFGYNQNYSDKQSHAGTTPRERKAHHTGRGPKAAGPRLTAELEVNGKFEDAVAYAANLFSQIVAQEVPPRLFPGISKAQYKSTAASDLTHVNSKIKSKIDGVTISTDILTWLNAWNAPHWMNLLDSLRNGATWAKDGTLAYAEYWGTSWARDLCQAWHEAGEVLNAYGLKNQSLTFNGNTDSNFAGTPTEHSSHDTGMAFDVDIPRTVEGVRTNALPVDTPLTKASITLSWIQKASYYAADVPTNADGTPIDIVGANRVDSQQRYTLRDILSLLALTSPDSTVRTALAARTEFKEGILKNLVRGLLIGEADNEYKDIRKVLNGGGMGITNNSGFATIYDDHHNHIHIFLRRPDPVSMP